MEKGWATLEEVRALVVNLYEQHRPERFGVFEDDWHRNLDFHTHHYSRDLVSVCLPNGHKHELCCCRMA